MERLNNQQIKVIELKILQYVVSLCDKNGLRYFLSYGTLLGAIRHRGFIPWDDDIDIVMPRDDYSKLIDILKLEQDRKYKVLVPGVDGYFYEFAKVVDLDTYVDEIGLENSERALWIDIFPLDGLDKKDRAHHRFFNIMHYFRVAAVYKKMPPSPLWARIPLFFFWRICRFIGWRPFLNMILKAAKKYKIDDCRYVGYAASFPGENKYIPKEYFKETVKVPFEGGMYNAPSMWDEYLKMLYGDYMKLPAEEKRIPHNIIAYKK